MKKIIFIMLFSLSILETSCNSQDKDVSLLTIVDIQQLKDNIKKDELWKEYVSTIQDLSKIIINNMMYANEATSKNPPNIASILSKVKSNDEARQVLLSSGFTKIYSDTMIKWLDCVKNLQQKFPQMTQLGPQKLNLQVPAPDEYPFNPDKDTKDFLANRKKAKQ